MVDGLAAFGHNMSRNALGGSIIQAILVDDKRGEITANADFRKAELLMNFDLVNDKYLLQCAVKFH